MRYFYLLSLVLSGLSLLAQDKSVKVIYPRTISIKSDSFKLYYPTWKEPETFKNIDSDTLDMGNDAVKNAYYLIISGHDTVRINYSNFPFAEQIFVPMELNGRKFTHRLRVKAVTAYFSADYITENSQKVNFDIPEVYELANIVWTLSKRGQTSNNLNKSSKYYQKALNYFSPFLGHSVFKAIDSTKKNYFEAYYDFRENSLAFSFEGDKIIRKEPYFYVMGNDDRSFSSLFEKLIPEIEDFAKTSNYRKFFADHNSYYKKSIKKQQKLIPVRKMWTWLEQNFDNKFNAYKIVYSPLIRATISTQNFLTFLPLGKGYFTESVMFVCGPEIFETLKMPNRKERIGYASGIVFTEIDHNYVNKLSLKYQHQIKSIFSNREIWASAGGDTERYSTALSVFNEYMTHAVFCRYVRQTFDKKAALKIIESRIDLMVNRRKYLKFREFTDKLISLDNRKKVKELYPEILNWASLIK